MNTSPKCHFLDSHLHYYHYSKSCSNAYDERGKKFHTDIMTMKKQTATETFQTTNLLNYWEQLIFFMFSNFEVFCYKGTPLGVKQDKDLKHVSYNKIKTMIDVS